MEIKIEINNEDFTQFAQKTAELGLDPLDTIELIIKKSLNERNLKSSIIKTQKAKNDTEELFIDYRIYTNYTKKEIKCNLLRF